jgi:hypothetical protein
LIGGVGHGGNCTCGQSGWISCRCYSFAI